MTKMNINTWTASYLECVYLVLTLGDYRRSRYPGWRRRPWGEKLKMVLLLHRLGNCGEGRPPRLSPSCPAASHSLNLSLITWLEIAWKLPHSPPPSVCGCADWLIIFGDITVKEKRGVCHSNPQSNIYIFFKLISYSSHCLKLQYSFTVLNGWATYTYIAVVWFNTPTEIKENI